MSARYKTVYLIRHGQNEISLKDPKLTSLGESQARQIKFSFGEVDGIVTSPTRRTIETATIIGQTLDVPCQVHDLVKERIDYSDVPNSGYTRFKQFCAMSSKNRDYILPNGESSYTSGLRLEYVMIRLTNVVDKGVIIVTHQGIISDYLRNKFSEDQLMEKLPLFVRLREDSLDNCSITRVDVRGHDHILQYIGKKNTEIL
jgi:broad specificity phosphatase PhoE